MTDQYGNGVTGLVEQDLTWAFQQVVDPADPGTWLPTSQVKVVPGSFSIGAAGFYSVGLYSTVAGEYAVTVSLRGIVSAPARVAFTPVEPFDANVSFAITPDRQTVGASVEAALSVRDRFDNPVTGLLASDIQLGLDGLTVLSGPVEQSPGRYVYALTTTDARTHTVTAAVGSVSKSDTVTFTSGAVSADKSAVSAAPATQTAGQNVAVTVTVKDIHDNPVLGLGAADFQIKGLSLSDDVPDVVGGGFFNYGDGRYGFSLTSRLVGQFEIEALVSGVTLSDHPKVAFTAGGVCVTNCDTQVPGNVTRVEMLVNDQLSDGSSEDTARVWA
ncbi:MAG: Ig-like domain-containing protein, partial [Propionibacteriaceae bacterium]|nr:Ig-like domain-containing protein [Propionibacteriaceae bacterium]